MNNRFVYIILAILFTAFLIVILLLTCGALFLFD